MDLTRPLAPGNRTRLFDGPCRRCVPIIIGGKEFWKGDSQHHIVGLGQYQSFVSERNQSIIEQANIWRPSFLPVINAILLLRLATRVQCALRVSSLCEIL